MSTTIAHRLAQMRPGETRRRLAAAEAAAARAEAHAQALSKTLQAIAAELTPVTGATFTDPAVARIQARRQRIAASSLTLVRS
jgi:hypothetical protein